MMNECAEINVILNKEATEEEWNQICEAIMEKATELGFIPIEAAIY